LSTYEPSYGVPHGGRPPDPPELPLGADLPPAWPTWYAPVGFLAAAAITLVVGVVVLSIAGVGPDEDMSPALVVVLTLVQNAILCSTAILLAARVRRPRPWHFGLRRAPFWPSVGWTGAGLGGYIAFVSLYAALIAPEGEQNVTEDLGADESTLALVAAGFVIIVVAPLAEEFFFRGFFYRALRSRLGILAAAGIDGVVFGLIHYGGSDTLELLPILGGLGFMFCLVYERTGTLYTVIGLHAFNNAIAYGFAVEEPGPSLVFGPLMFLGCIFGPRLLHSRRTATPA
jgi:uncharacterized protein